MLTDVSGNALSSLLAVDQWVKTLNTTVAGASQVGFKAQKITFGGGSVKYAREGLGGLIPEAYAEQSLNIGGTNTDFTQGEIVASTEYTHLAIGGSDKAFFVLTDQPSTGTAANANYSAGTNFYYTRDGEFHLDRDGYLRNKDGLYVMGNADRTGTGGGTLQVGTSIRLNDANTSNDPQGYVTQMISNFNDPTGPAGPYFMVGMVQNLTGLQFSKFGKTIFNAGSMTATGAFTGATGGPGAISLGRVSTSASHSAAAMTGNALEASNVKLPSSMTELSFAQKIFSALTKVIETDMSRYDNIFTLFR